jgi:hypothetical protein
MKNSIVDIRIVEPRAWAVDDLKNIFERRTEGTRSFHTLPCAEPQKNPQTLTGVNGQSRAHLAGRRLNTALSVARADFFVAIAVSDQESRPFFSVRREPKRKRHWKLVSLTILGGSRTKRYRVSVVS